jgi:hypothetical protein
LLPSAVSTHERGEVPASLHKRLIIIIIIIIIIMIDVAIPSDKNVIQKEAEKKLKYKNLSMYRNSENVEHEMLCHTSNHWGHRNCEQKFTKMSVNNTRTTLNRFFTKNCHTRNITHHKESATS